MKKSLAAAVLMAAFFIPGLAKADDHDSIVKAMAEKRNEHTLEVMTSGLNLSTDQQAAVKLALDTQSQELMDLQKELIDKEKAILDQTDAQIITQLTEAQKDKYPDVKAKVISDQAQLQNSHLNLGGNSSSGDDAAPSAGGRHGGGRHGGMGGGY